MKITELDSKRAIRAMGAADIDLFRDNMEVIVEMMDCQKAMIMKALYIFNYGVAIGKNQERNRRARGC